MTKALIIILSVSLFLVISLFSIYFISDSIFTGRVERELQSISSGVVIKKQMISQNEMAKLPFPVQKWLENSGTLLLEKTQTVRLKQTGEMRTTPTGAWMNTEAVQYFTVEKPAFVWKAKIKPFALFPITGRDLYKDGRGSMLIKAFSLFTVADAQGSKMDQGTLLRFLAETAWFPSAVLSPYIKWEPMDDYSAKATMSYGEITASGIFRFNKDYDVISFEAQRYMERQGVYTLETWMVPMIEHKKLNGIKIPVKGNIVWKFKEGDFSWFNWEITGIEYNVKLTP